MEGLSATMAECFTNCFGLLARLSEVEGMVRVLQLVSVLVEVMGPRIQPQLGLLAAALPDVWSTASNAAAAAAASASSAGMLNAAASSSNDGKASEAGAVVRLHGALMAVLNHLVARLRDVAINDPRIQGVVYPLLQYATGACVGRRD